MLVTPTSAQQIIDGDRRAAVSSEAAVRNSVQAQVNANLQATIRDPPIGALKAPMGVNPSTLGVHVVDQVQVRIRRKRGQARRMTSRNTEKYSCYGILGVHTDKPTSLQPIRA